MPESIGRAPFESAGMSCHLAAAARLCSIMLDGAAILSRLDDNESD